MSIVLSMANARRSLLMATVALACGALHAAPAPTVEFYASPGGNPSASTCPPSHPCSLGRARTLAQNSAISMQSNVVVYLKQGEYVINNGNPFALGAADSGRNGFQVIYTNAPGEEAVFTGGKTISPNWQVYDQPRNIYRAPLPSGLVPFRQLYVNGTRAIRARQPNLTNEDTRGGYAQAQSGHPFKVSTSTLLSPTGGSWIGAATGAEVVWLANWLQKRARIHAVNHDNGSSTITFKSPEGADCLSQYLICKSDGTRVALPTPFFYLENALEMLDAEGEWYHDRVNNDLYYKPRANETFSSVTLPQAKILFRIDAAENIEVRGLKFRYSNWNDPDEYGYINSQAALSLRNVPSTNNMYLVPAMFRIWNASHIRVENNVFEHGGAHAILMDMSNALKGNSIVGNEIQDMAAGGIYEYASSQNTLIMANKVHHIGRDYSDAVGIFASLPYGMNIEFNEVFNTPYSGISFGWKWDFQEGGVAGNIVQHNLVHHVMQLHDDGGAIYSLGSMPSISGNLDGSENGVRESAIKWNHIHGIAKSPYTQNLPVAAIYLDQGSRFKGVHHNVFDTGSSNPSTYAIYAVNGQNQENPIDYNHYNGNFGYAGVNPVGTHNLLETNGWSGSALSIIAGAGTVKDELSVYRQTASSVVNGSQPDYPPQNAADGKTDQNGWASTIEPRKFYWQINLWSNVPPLPAKRIKKIEIVAPASAVANGTTLKNIEIWLSNEANMSASHTTVASLGNVEGKMVWSVVLDDTIPYKYLAIIKTVPEPFALSEVRVYR